MRYKIFVNSNLRIYHPHEATTCSAGCCHPAPAPYFCDMDCWSARLRPLHKSRFQHQDAQVEMFAAFVCRDTAVRLAHHLTPSCIIRPAHTTAEQRITGSQHAAMTCHRQPQPVPVPATIYLAYASLMEVRSHELRCVATRGCHNKHTWEGCT